MRRLFENVVLVVVFLLLLGAVRQGWAHRADLSAWLGRSDSRMVDATLGWLPIGGLLAAVGTLPLRRHRRSVAEKAAYLLLLAPWGVLAATYFWTPLAGGRSRWLDDLSAGGEAFRSGVVVSHGALAASVALCLALGFAQVVSPRWQPGNEVNERRSAVASSVALTAPALLALAVAWVV